MRPNLKRMEQSTSSIYPSPSGEDGDEIKPYKIHVSSKYLDLTRKKLELTRLPHELLLPKDREWELGTPKSEVEPLVDFWLEHYSWRAQETKLNATLPQFRTAISIPDSPHPLRMHFIHIRSSHPAAIPLLLIPQFPLTNLSLAPLFPALVNPGAGEEHAHAFHLVVPSLPGLGFSDAFQTDEHLLSKTATMLDTLMHRLGYDLYLASGTGSGAIDNQLLSLLSTHHPTSCLGVHLISPPISAPRFQLGSLWNWLKLTLARVLHAPLFGYTKQDLVALRAAHARRKAQKTASWGTAHAGLHTLGLTLANPHTLSYALTDSPVGLLSLVCAALHAASPNHALTQTQVVDLTQLAWLPGPEAGMRFVAAAASEIRSLDALKVATKQKTKTKTNVAITVFATPDTDTDTYTCPIWANSQHNQRLIWTQRLPSRIGLPIWERPQLLLDGIRGLASGVTNLDSRLATPELQSVVVHAVESEPREPVGPEIVTVVEVGEFDEEDAEGGENQEEEGEIGGEEQLTQLDVESPDTVVAVDMGRS